MLEFTFILVVLLLPLAYILVFNGLRRAQTRVQEGWSGIEVQLKRRHDLVPNLVDAVKGALSHEAAIFERLSKAREDAIQALRGNDKQTIATSEAALSSAVRALNIRVEDNPEITATGNVETFQRQLEETEDQIAASRRLYNGNVQGLNARVRTFPGNFVASWHTIDVEEPYEMTAEERTVTYVRPAVDLG